MKVQLRDLACFSKRGQKPVEAEKNATDDERGYRVGNGVENKRQYRSQENQLHRQARREKWVLRVWMYLIVELIANVRWLE